MPFEIAPQKLSAAEQLAALIEAGRAANPSMKHRSGVWGDGRTFGCAMTFAFKAAGFEQEPGSDLVPLLAETMDVSAEELKALVHLVVTANDDARASLDEIAVSLRTGVWPTAPTYAHVKSFVWVSMNDFAKMYPAPNANVEEKFYTWDVSYVGDPLKFDAAILKPKKTAKPQPAKKVRTSAKNGATWPVAKHAYA